MWVQLVPTENPVWASQRREKIRAAAEVVLHAFSYHFYKGKKHLQAFQLRENTDSTQIYCTKCWAILGVDHVNYPDSTFLNFPEFCVNTGDLSVPLSAYIMMSDYNEDIGPEPTESVPLFESLRYQQERDRLFALADPQKTFSEPDQPLAGYTFRSLLADLDPPTILNISDSSNVLTEFK